MKKSYIIIFIVSAIAIIACQKEDELTPSNNERFYFEVAADANDPTSVLRREFAEKTGSFLLFNDTLYKEQKGYSANGEPIWEIETVKMSYYITNDDSYRYTYDYIEDYDEQKQLTDIVKDYFMPRLGKANPYSVLLVKKIYKWETNNGVYVLDTWNGAHPTMINGVRCLALAMGEREDMGEEEFYNYIFNTYVANYIDKLYDNDYSSFDPFYNYCDNIYGYSKKELGYEREYNDSLAMSLGFWSDWNNNYFPSKSNDLKLYKTAICETPMSEVENMREEFPIVYEKFKFLRDLVLASGIILKD